MTYRFFGEQENAALTAGSPSGTSDAFDPGYGAGVYTSPFPGIIGLSDQGDTSGLSEPTPFYKSTAFWGNVVAIAAVLVLWRYATRESKK